MTPDRGPFLGWPEARHLRFAGLLAVLGFAWFAAIFSATNAFTRWRDMRVRVHLDAELALPFVPEAILIYLSIHLLIFAAPLILRERRPLLALAVALNTTTLLAGFCFLLIPAHLAFPSPPLDGVFGPLIRAADAMNLTYNLVPSLHVAFSVVCAAAFAQRAPLASRIILYLWVGAIAVSTLLTHQHHVVDVAAGIALGWFVHRKIYQPRATPRPSSAKMDPGTPIPA